MSAQPKPALEGKTVGEALVTLLEGYGVEVVFGIPGVHTISLYKGLPGSSIRHVLTRHEQGAAFMADGYARVTGKPGVCLLITGPGITNAATAIGQAYSDSQPMLILSAVNQRASLGRGYGHLHEMKDQRALTSAITGFSATALTPSDVPDLIARAFALFRGNRPRPVHIELPLDVIDSPAEGDWRVRHLNGPPVPALRETEAAAELLRKAERPLIIAGGGAVDAGPAIAALAERLGAPVITTVAAKGVLPPRHPLHVGQGLQRGAGLALLKEADKVLVLGSELGETDHWQERLPIPGDIIRVDLDSAKLVDLYPARLAILGDAGAAAEAMLAALGSGTAKSAKNWGAGRVTAARQELAQPRSGLNRKHENVLAVMKKVLPEDAVIASDMTQIAYTANVTYDMGRPRSWLHPLGYGTLGYALPAAIGAKLAAPERVVVAVAGDHGFLYTGQDLITAVEEKLPLVVVLWHNHALGAIRDGMIQRGIQQIAVTPIVPDYLMLAKAYGAKAVSATSLADLEKQLAAAIGSDEVTLIEVREQIAG
ncbi:MAG TPA: 5-guanidino-2-oxopentanoate decarboxylase [Kiloniellales bacterium]|nr:5-guanidino-2-oxopentanoate decarboxylase [Kiloniellales bacterium]